MLLAVGDVAGHGLAAASAMAQLRNCLRAYAVEDPDPARLLARVDRATAALSPEVIATVVIAVFEPDTGRVVLASAGHPSPILRQGRDSRLLEIDPSPPLGVVSLASAEGHPSTAELTLGPGDSLLLVSDGMFERRGEAIDVSLEDLVRLTDAALVQYSDTDAVLEDLLERAPGTSIDDDVTLLLLRGT